MTDDERFRELIRQNFGDGEPTRWRSSGSSEPTNVLDAMDAADDADTEGWVPPTPEPVRPRHSLIWWGVGLLALGLVGMVLVGVWPQAPGWWRWLSGGSAAVGTLLLVVGGARYADARRRDTYLS